jgi:hypothetical protein
MTPIEINKVKITGCELYLEILRGRDLACDTTNRTCFFGMRLWGIRRIGL